MIHVIKLTYVRDQFVKFREVVVDVIILNLGSSVLTASACGDLRPVALYRFLQNAVNAFQSSTAKSQWSSTGTTASGFASGWRMRIGTRTGGATATSAVAWRHQGSLAGSAEVRRQRGEHDAWVGLGYSSRSHHGRQRREQPVLRYLIGEWLRADRLGADRLTGRGLVVMGTRQRPHTERSHQHRIEPRGGSA